MLEDRVVHRGLGLEHVEADPREPPGLQGRECRVEVEQPAPTAVDEDGARLGPRQQRGADQVEVLRGQRHVQRQHVARGDQLVEVGARHLGGRRRVRVVGEHPHPEGRGQLTHAAADPAVSDDPDGRAVEITDRPAGVALGPPAPADQGGQRGDALDQGEGVREDPLGDGAGAAAGGDDHGDAARGRCVEVDQVRAHPGPGEHPHPRSAVEERGVDHDVGADDRADRGGQVGLGGLGDEVDPVAERARDQVGLDRAQAHDHRPARGAHRPTPTVAGSPP